MWMCIAVVGFAMRGPTGMTDADMGVKIFAYQGFFEVGYLAFFLVYLEAAVEQGYAGTIVPAVFEALQAFQDYRVSFFRTSICYYSAHGCLDFEGCAAKKRKTMRNIMKIKASGAKIC